MPFLKNIIIDDQTKIKIWKVTLGELSHNELNNEDKKLLKKKRSGLLRDQFLATRKMLSLENSDYEITYDLDGKPNLNNESNISISHSHELVAFVISDNCKAGIDVQLKEIKILNIQNKFLNKFEKFNIGEDPSIDILTMIWASKESIYKAIGIKGISFSENIKIDGVVEKDKTGQGYYINGAEKVKFDLKFFYLDEYIICYAHQSL